MNTKESTVPPDNLRRQLAVARPNDDDSLPHVGVVSDTYTLLISGEQTAGKYCLIDMLVPPGGGPPPHRHDFEEMFTVLEGEVEVTFRGKRSHLRAGESANVPANAPHHFRNASERPARLLCLCAPAGQEEFFRALGVPLPARTSPAPKFDAAAEADFRKKAGALAAKFRTEILPPPGH